ncbi:hypothetical protein B0T14DRAFT_435690 [Immersiella caudata]|uniref:C2H2-type domain-containing protein n=1 Tax=Immersiella caudata TaxID=314043 RepID=A0AA40BWM4_9PEZI|nr:hypothetical protein B0T14DRAFT_435690 [Immersiella caudata]
MNGGCYSAEDYSAHIKQEPGLYEEVPESTNALSIAQILAYTPKELEAAAKAITKNATSLLANNSFDPANTLYITPGAIEERSWGTGEKRQAIQDVLESYLFYYYYENPSNTSEPTALLLDEAACQIQWCVEGEKTQEICRFAILCALQSLRGNTGSPASEKHQTPAKSSEKGHYPCRFADCGKVFGRSADCDRHEKMIHTDEGDRKSYYCDYKKCPRHTTPFYRQDHYRDHYRDQHFEDLLRRSVKPPKDWWVSRASALRRSWFRCNKCLVQRVDIATHGYSCPKCGHTCEQERQRRRRSIHEASFDPSDLS